METDPRVGTVIAARYRIDQIIGAGAMGIVYEAHDLTTSRRVALKIVPTEHDEAAARLVREAKTLHMLEHRNIVSFIDTGTLDDGKFLVIELVRGVTLRELVSDGIVEPRRALAIVRQLLDAVGHAHRLGVIHRDVTPENIMLADGGSESGGSELVKVLDFGVAKLANDTAALLSEGKLTKTGFECIGTARYMAPEVALGRPVDARADLYSIGVILFELLTGKPPFDDADPVAILQHHAATPVPMLRDITPDRTFTTAVEYLVAEALAKTADRRFASAADMSAAVDAATRSIEASEVIEIAPVLKVDSTLPFPPLRAPSGPTMRPMPPTPHEPLPVVVPGPYAPLASRSMSWLRGRRNWVIGGASGLLLVIICIAAAASDGPASIPGAAKVAAAQPAPARSEIARHGLDLLASGNVTDAITHLESAVATNPRDADSYLALGHARIKANRRVDAIGAYERALKLSPALATDPQLATNLAIVLETKDAVAGVLALELLTKLARHDAIAAQASAHKLLEVRHRAVSIAERDGFADKIDRITSWSLDLTQLSGCESRRVAITKLRSTDKRAIPALRRARSLACIEPDATEAIAYLETKP